MFQGEREMAADNKLLGQFDLVGIPPSPRGVPQIEVAFDIDANGIVNVSAKDKATGKEQQIRIQASGGLNDDEIDRMVHDAETHAEEDQKRKELVEARNHAEAMVHSVEKMLEEHGDKVGVEEKSDIEAKIADVRTALASEDAAEIGAKMEQLSQASMKLGESVYKDVGGPEADMAGMGGAAGPDAAGPADPDDAPAPDNVVDAEFEELDNEDKNQRSN